MTTLNLTASRPEQKILLAHLTPLVSDVLAEKINNGVKITKDGKELLGRKTLDTFMEYLIEEISKMKTAKKYKRASVAGMEGNDILKRAIKYFEDDKIEGKLFNADGTEYEQAKSAKPYSAVELSVDEMQKFDGNPETKQIVDAETGEITLYCSFTFK